jgi:hypothetical protein
VVLRAYDNRAVYTQRRPDVYLQSEGLAGPTEVVCDFIDGRCSAGEALAATVTPTAKDFGCIPEGSDSLDWLWADREAAGCSARLLVITTPYYPGRHWARSAGEFLPLIEQLEQFHANNFVHGDIRATNVAFCDGSEGRSRLIDWDMGGKVREPAPTEASEEVESPSVGEVLKYPEGYRDLVFDGGREGQGGEAITKVHDWAALTDLILGCHRFLPPHGGMLPRIRLLEEKIEVFPFFDADVGRHVSDLRQFLSEAENLKWDVRPNPMFRKKLVYYGYVKEDDPELARLERGSADAAPENPVADKGQAE